MKKFTNSTRQTQTAKRIPYKALFLNLLPILLLFFTATVSIAQEIEISGGSNDVSITSGDMTPSTDDGTDQGEFVASVGAFFSFTVRNDVPTFSEESKLSITDISITGEHASEFEVTSSFPLEVYSTNTNPFNRRSISLKLTPAASSLRSAIITVTNNDGNGDETSFSFKIQATAVDGALIGLNGPRTPQLGGGRSSNFSSGRTSTEISNGTEFGDLKVDNDNRCYDFKIFNKGNIDLTFSEEPIQISGDAAANFSVVKQPVGPLGSNAVDTSSFVICYDPSQATRDTVLLTINSNDLNNPLYTFNISGRGTNDLICDYAFSEYIDETPGNFAYLAASNNTIWGITQRQKGLFKSTDDGASFTYTDNLFGGSIPLKIKYEESTNLLVVGTFGGKLYTSTDGGNNFTASTNSYTLNQDGFHIDGNIIYAYSGTGFTSSSTKLLKSTDNGVTFTELVNSPNNTVNVWASDNTIYVTQRIIENGFFNKFYVHKSTDGGANFSQLNQEFGKTIQSIDVVGNKVYVGTLGNGLYISEDGGNNFTQYATPEGVSEDVEDVLVIGDTIYVGSLNKNNNNDGLPGLSYSYDNGTTWQNAIAVSKTGRIYSLIKYKGKLWFGGFGFGECACRELQLLGNNVEILDEHNTPKTEDHTDFGEVGAGQSVSRTFTLKSLYRDPINLYGTPIVSIEGANASAFSITTQPSDNVLKKDESTTFTVKFIASGDLGDRMAIIRLATNDFSEDTLTFNIKATILAGIPVTINQGSSQADPTNSSPIVFAVVFDETVTGFDENDITLEGTAGATTASVSGSGANYTVTVSGMTGSGTVIAKVKADAATGTSGTKSLASSSTDNQVTYDNVKPTVSINQKTGQADPTNGTTINFTVEFSETVTGFIDADVTLSGTAGATTATITGSGPTYNVAVTGMTASGTVIASIAANKATDAAGNSNTASTSTDNMVTYDITKPTVTINQASGQGDPTNNTTINFTVVFSESVSDFATGDLTLIGTAGATTGTVTGSGMTYNVAVTGMTSAGTVIASIAADKATDAAGNGNTASTTTDNEVTYDNVKPTVSINQKTGQADPTNSSTINFTVVFSETTTNFITGDVTLSGTAGATTATVTGSGMTYNVAVTGMTASGTVIASIAADKATDAAGNGNVASTSTDNEVNYDNVKPTVTINQATGQGDPTNNSTINFTVVFNETTTTFATGDVSLSGTAAGTLTGTVTGSGTTYNVAVTGMTASGTVIASIAADKATDAAGNGNTASTTTDNEVTYDNVKPTVTINQKTGQADPTNGTTIDFTVVFSETTTNFITGDVTLSGTAGATTATVTGSGTTYNVAVTGMTTSGTVIASIAADKATDAAGNGNTASTNTDNEVTYDKDAPTVNMFTPVDNATEQATNTNLVLTFSENVQKGTGNIIIYKKSDNNVVETIDVTNAIVSVSGATVTINPMNNLAIQTEYYVQIASTAFTDVVGNAYVGISNTTDWSFTTANLICPTLGTITDPSDICQGNTFNVSIAGLVNMAAAANLDKDFGIKFVAFSTTTTTPYTGGTALGTVAFASLTGTAPNQTAALNNVGNSLAAGNYVIYAILSTPHADASCQPHKSVNLTVKASPSITFTSSVNGTICSGTDVTFTATGGTTYQFFVNNVSKKNGATATYTTNTLVQGDKVKVTVTDAQNCPVTSSEYTANVNSTDSDSDSVPDCRDICPGGNDLGPDLDNDNVPDECDCDPDDNNDAIGTASDFGGNITTGDYKAGLELTADKTILNGNSVRLWAGKAVLLKPGFHAQASSNVHAFIAPCVTPSTLVENDKVVERSTITLPHDIQYETIDLTVAPNPFHGQTNLNFRLPTDQSASVALFDQTGRMLKYLLSPQALVAGDYNIRIIDEGMQTGMYHVVLQTATERITKKVIRVR